MCGGAIRCRRRCSALQQVSVGSRSVAVAGGRAGGLRGVLVIIGYVMVLRFMISNFLFWWSGFFWNGWLMNALKVVWVDRFSTLTWLVRIDQWSF